MPIYEFYCDTCNTIYNFFSKTINTTKIPNCPKCETTKLSRQMSIFSVTGKAAEDGDGMDDFPMDEAKMEKAMNMLAKEAENINEDDPRQAAGLMRKLTDMTGVELGVGMEEAIRRMERGDDPDQIEAEMGDLIEGEEPFILPGHKGKAGKRGVPFKDETLYDL